MDKTYLPGEERTLEYIERLNGILGMMQSAPAEARNPLMEAFLSLCKEDDEIRLKCLREGLPLVSTWYGNAQEILVAMGIAYGSPVFDLLLHEYFTELKDLYAMDSLALPDDICSLIRLGTYGQRNNLLPKPQAVIAMMEPCDSQPFMHESFKLHGWDDIPYFYLDYPYGTSDEDWDYFAGELRRLIAFLENIFPNNKMDYNKLREVIEETNKQYEIWNEYSELQRNIPCPGGSFQGSAVGWALTQHHQAADPRATDLLRAMVAHSEQMVKEGKGAVPNEKIRILWADLDPQWGELIAPWLAEKYNAVIVQSFQGYTAPYTSIDCSTTDSMLKGLARRALHEVPMIRQARGTVDSALEDIERIVKDYSCNCVFLPAHMGHKDVSAESHFVRDLCKELGVPLLMMNVSLFDERYFPIDQLKKKITDFFEATGLA